MQSKNIKFAFQRSDRKKMKRNKHTMLAITSGLVVIACLTGGYLYRTVCSPLLRNEKTAYLYIDRDDDIDSVRVKIRAAGRVTRMEGFDLLAAYDGYGRKIRTGRYALNPGGNMLGLYKTLSRGRQTPLMLTVPATKTIGQLVKTIDRQLMIDSAEIRKSLTDTATIKQWGFDERTLPAFFIPDTYECYWNVSPQALLRKLRQAYQHFWNEQRTAQAAAVGLTPIEAATLASIVDEETSKNDEKPIIAGLYLNRLKKGMRLQADPTVKFALNDPAVRRILFQHLEVDSPYNTYKHEGLPPGPIRIASVQGIESVLNYVRHTYLYMCAKEDFSGYHHFAVNSAQHAANARRYQQALNRRHIH